MKPVLQQIFRLKREYARLPFFDYLRDDTLPAVERLSFFPCMAPFILSFGDLNRHVLRLEPTDDPYLKMINAHSYEDDHHWPWYLEDFAKLGYDDDRQKPTETLRYLWSDATIQNRLLSHRLAHLIWGAAPAVRLAIIEAIEETGNVLFALTSRLAAEVERETGSELRYCGEFHFLLESGHAMNNDHAELAEIVLEPALRADAHDRVEQVFAWFADWTEELLRYARQERGAERVQREGVPAAMAGEVGMERKVLALHGGSLEGSPTSCGLPQASPLQRLGRSFMSPPASGAALSRRTARTRQIL